MPAVKYFLFIFLIPFIIKNQIGSVPPLCESANSLHSQKVNPFKQCAFFKLLALNGALVRFQEIAPLSVSTGM